MSEGSPGGVTRGGRHLIIEGRAGISAPLLAGFSLALVGVIAQDPTNFRWPGIALVVLMIPIFCFLGAIRAGYRARSMLDAESDLAEAEANHRRYLWWGYVTFLAFGAGLFSLWVCIAIIVAPPTSGGHEVAFRWVAFAMAIAASINELVIIAARIPKARRIR